MNLDRSVYAGSARRRYALAASSAISVAMSALAAGIVLGPGMPITALVAAMLAMAAATLAYTRRNVEAIDMRRVCALAMANVLILAMLLALG